MSMHNPVRRHHLAIPTTAIILSIGGTAAGVPFLPVHGGPTYDPATGIGIQAIGVPSQGNGVNAVGIAVGSGLRYAGTTNLGSRAFRWDPTGSVAELGTLGVSPVGRTSSAVRAVDASGAAFGYADRYVEGIFRGPRAVRWDPTTTVPIELGNLGSDASGAVYAANASGLAVGYAGKFGGTRAVRWEAGQTAATELGHIGTNPQGLTNAYALAVNAAGTAVGFADKFNGYFRLGHRAVRWEAGGTDATELDDLGTANTDKQTSRLYAIAVDNAGNAYGYGPKYINNVHLGLRAIRWSAGGSAATELDHLGTNANGRTHGLVVAANAAGVAVGLSEKYSNGQYLGDRAVRWDPGSTVAIELGHLGTVGAGLTTGGAHAINSHGTIVGSMADYDGSSFLGDRAVMWLGEGAAIDLNTLIDPASGWTLTQASSISDTHFVAGLGLFDPDGTGPLQPYPRLFLLDVSSAVPEPASLALPLTAALLLARRRPR